MSVKIAVIDTGKNVINTIKKYCEDSKKRFRIYQEKNIIQ